MKPLQRLTRGSFLLSSLIVASSISASLAWSATSVIPPCLDHGKDLPVNNAQVADWKTTTQNQFLGRGHVTGMIKQIFPDHSKHNHFEIQMDTAAGDTLEIIFSQCDGTLPMLQAGMKVEACGDYITATAQSGHNQPSPDGAILHWVHKSLPTDLCGHNYGTGGGHDSGYLAIDGQVYGGY